MEVFVSSWGPQIIVIRGRPGLAPIPGKSLCSVPPWRMSCDRRLGGNGGENGQISIKMEGNMEDLELLIGKSSTYGKTCI